MLLLPIMVLYHSIVSLLRVSWHQPVIVLRHNLQFLSELRVTRMLYSMPQGENLSPTHVTQRASPIQTIQTLLVSEQQQSIQKILIYLFSTPSIKIIIRRHSTFSMYLIRACSLQLYQIISFSQEINQFFIRRETLFFHAQRNNNVSGIVPQIIHITVALLILASPLHRCVFLHAKSENIIVLLRRFVNKLAKIVELFRVIITISVVLMNHVIVPTVPMEK